MSFSFVVRLAVFGLLSFAIFLTTAGLYGLIVSGGGEQYGALAGRGAITSFVILLSLAVGRPAYGAL